MDPKLQEQLDFDHVQQHSTRRGYNPPSAPAFQSAVSTNHVEKLVARERSGLAERIQ
jgi:hypothetical protein